MSGRRALCGARSAMRLMPGERGCLALPLAPGHPSVQAPEEGASRSDPGALWLWMVSDAGFTARRQCVDLERLFPVSSSLKWGSWPQLLERLE